MGYEYDAAGQLVAVDYGGAESSFGYNYAGMKTSMDDADMGFWGYGYDAQGRRKRITAGSWAAPVGSRFGWTPRSG